MTMTLTFRHATPADAPTVTSLWAGAMIRQYGDDFLDTLEEGFLKGRLTLHAPVLQDPEQGRILLGYDQEKKPVVFAWIQDNLPEAPHAIELVELYAIRKGAGSRMLREVESLRKLAEDNKNEILVSARGPSAAFYTKQGYETLERCGQTTHMRKSL